MFMMLPWVLLGIMLAIGLLVSVIYTSVKFYIDGDNLNGTCFLVFGLIAFGMYNTIENLLRTFVAILVKNYAEKLRLPL